MFEARFHRGMDAFSASAWDRLAGVDNPFVRHAFLAGLEQFACIRPEWGWRPHHLGLYEDEQLVAAAPVYLKGNSRGEFVFDWGWAQAWEEAGGSYYPKLLNASPWSPVTGPRLLAGDGDNAPRCRRALTDALRDECVRLGLSTVHANFLTAADDGAFADDWLQRNDIQFHWHNRGYRDFADFLADLRRHKRKNIRQERRHAAQSGLACTMHDGADLNEDEWAVVHGLYCRTFAEKGNFAVLSCDFLQHLAHCPEIEVRVAAARRGRNIVAMALFLQGSDTLYGRYWGASEHHSSLHFELCYYLGIEHCIRHGLTRFEPGAQGRHKMARGFLPTRTRSRHFIAHGGFRAAVAAALARETQAIDAWQRELEAHSPFAERADAMQDAST